MRAGGGAARCECTKIKRNKTYGRAVDAIGYHMRNPYW